MKDETVERALLLLTAPEIGEEVIAAFRQLGEAGRQVLRAAASGEREDVNPKERAHAIDLLALADEIDDDDLRKLAAEPGPSVRRHALLALQDRGRADLLVESLGHKQLEPADQAIVLRGLARVGDTEQVKDTLAWAAQRDEIDLRNLAATAIRAMRQRRGSPRDVDDVDLLRRELEDS